jgi:hypothetical protein
MIRRPEHYGEVWGEGEFTSITAKTLSSSYNSLGELWWEFENIREAGTEGMRFDAEFCATDCARALRKDMNLPESAAVRPGRLYIVVSKDGKRQSLVLECSSQKDFNRAQAMSVFQDPEWEQKVSEAWFVGTQDVAADLIDAEWDGAPGHGLPEKRSLCRLHDGRIYGPETLALSLSGEARQAWATRPVSIPDQPAVLRGAIGFEAGTASRRNAKACVRLEAGGKTWDLVKDMVVEVYPSDSEDPFRSNAPAIIEAELPTEARGKEGRFVLEAEGANAARAVLVLPWLKVCEGK